MLKWVLLALGIVMFLVAMVVVVGMLVPKSHSASRSVRLPQPPGTVWATLTDFASHPSWRPGLRSMERLPDRDGHAVWRETSRMGTLTYEIVELDPPRRMVMRIADPSLPFGGSWTYEIAPLAEGCSLTVTENGEIYNPVFRFMARFVFGYTATMDAYLEALRRKLDTGAPQPA